MRVAGVVILLLTLLALILVSMAMRAQAKGIVRVHQADGTIQTYADVTVRVVPGKALRITTRDGKGTLVINNAACSYQGEIRRCILYGAALEQGGQTHSIQINHGTIYFNLTDQDQTLPLSSQRIPPKGLVMSLETRRGTYVSATGTIDAGLPR